MVQNADESENEKSHHPKERVKGVELLTVLVALSVIIALQLVINHGAILFSRPLWQDEAYTHLLTADPDLFHSFRALKGGVDTNPPALYLLLRVFALPFGGISNITMRLFALISVLAALVGLYSFMREANGRVAATIATLAAWAHPMATIYAFDARFYGPMMALSIWFCLLLRKRRVSSKKRHIVALALVSLLLCTIHYFGIFVFFLTTLGELSVEREQFRKSAARLWPAALGPLGLLACIPIYLGQSAGMRGLSWVTPFSVAYAREFFESLIPGPALAAVMCVFLLSKVFAGVNSPQNTHQVENWRYLASITAILAMPLMVIAFSIIVQPAMINRYIIPIILPFAAASGVAVSRVRVPIAACLALILISIATANMKHEVTHSQQQNAVITDEVRNLRSLTGSEPVVFLSRSMAHEVLDAYPEISARAYLFNTEVSTPEGTKAQLMEIQLARKTARFYSPRLITETQLAKLQTFYIASRADTETQLAIVSNHTQKAVGEHVFLMNLKNVTPR